MKDRKVPQFDFVEETEQDFSSEILMIEESELSEIGLNVEMIEEEVQNSKFGEIDYDASERLKPSRLQTANFGENTEASGADDKGAAGANFDTVVNIEASIPPSIDDKYFQTCMSFLKNGYCKRALTCQKKHYLELYEYIKGK